MDTPRLRAPQIKSKEPVKTCYFFLYRISGQIKKAPTRGAGKDEV